MKFQKFEISFLIFGSILVVLFNVILVALKVLVVFEIFKETSNKFAVKFLSSRTVLETEVSRQPGFESHSHLKNLLPPKWDHCESSDKIIFFVDKYDKDFFSY